MAINQFPPANAGGGSGLPEFATEVVFQGKLTESGYTAPTIQPGNYKISTAGNSVKVELGDNNSVFFVNGEQDFQVATAEAEANFTLAPTVNSEDTSVYFPRPWVAQATQRVRGAGITIDSSTNAGMYIRRHPTASVGYIAPRRLDGSFSMSDTGSAAGKYYSISEAQVTTGRIAHVCQNGKSMFAWTNTTNNVQVAQFTDQFNTLVTFLTTGVTTDWGNVSPTFMAYDGVSQIVIGNRSFRSGVYSTNNGASWTFSSTLFPAALTSDSTVDAIKYENGQFIALSNSAGQYYNTTNVAGAWSTGAIGGAATLTDVVHDGTNFYFSDTSNRQVYVGSSLASLTTRSVTFSTTSGGIQKLIRTPAGVYAISNSASEYVFTTNAGVSWTRVNGTGNTFFNQIGRANNSHSNNNNFSVDVLRYASWDPKFNTVVMAHGDTTSSQDYFYDLVNISLDDNYVWYYAQSLNDWEDRGHYRYSKRLGLWVYNFQQYNNIWHPPTIYNPTTGKVWVSRHANGQWGRNGTASTYYMGAAAFIGNRIVTTYNSAGIGVRIAYYNYVTGDNFVFESSSSYSNNGSGAWVSFENETDPTSTYQYVVYINDTGSFHFYVATRVSDNNTFTSTGSSFDAQSSYNSSRPMWFNSDNSLVRYSNGSGFPRINKFAVVTPFNLSNSLHIGDGVVDIYQASGVTYASINGGASYKIVNVDNLSNYSGWYMAFAYAGRYYWVMFNRTILVSDNGVDWTVAGSMTNISRLLTQLDVQANKFTNGRLLKFDGELKAVGTIPTANVALYNTTQEVL